MRKPFFLLLLFSPFLLLSKGFANPWASLNSGEQVAQELLNKIDQDKAKTGGYPFYDGREPIEVNFKGSDLNGVALSIAKGDSASQMVHESANVRAQFKIDPQSDPLLKVSDKILVNPLEAIGGKGTQAVETMQGGKDETLLCEEAGEDAEHTCKSSLVVTIKEERGPLQQGSIVLNGPALYYSYIHQGLFSMPRVCKKHHVAFIQNIPHLLSSIVFQKTNIPKSDIESVTATNNGGWVQVGHKRYSFSSYTVYYNYRPRIKTPVFTWHNECEALEERVDGGLCYYGSQVCTQGPQTRIIDGISVTQDCWQYTYTYNCSYPSKNDCGPLRVRGCVQINSACKQRVGKACVVYSQTYQCKGPQRTLYSITGGQTPFCLDGNCRDQSFHSNDEMLSALAQLSILKEMQGQLSNGSIFKGQNNQCTKYILNFKDCCGSGKGWGKSMNLSSCSSDEKALSEKRKKGFCHYVGTYCAEKVLGQCVKKKSSYCCFSNKLLKAFHEQGRPQIGLGWGEPKEPLCRGYTLEEIQRIDFSKLDLSEVFEDLMKNYNPSKMQNIGQQVSDRLEIMKKSLLPKAITQPSQGKEG